MNQGFVEKFNDKYFFANVVFNLYIVEWRIFVLFIDNQNNYKEETIQQVKKHNIDDIDGIIYKLYLIINF